jgi:hypothetical protein
VSGGCGVRERERGLRIRVAPWRRVLIGRLAESRRRGRLGRALTGPCRPAVPRGPPGYSTRSGHPAGWSDSPNMAHMLVVVSCLAQAKFCVLHVSPFSPAQNYRNRRGQSRDLVQHF